MQSTSLRSALLALALASATGCAGGGEAGGLPAGYLGERDLPAGLLDGLTPAQKHEVLLAMNEEETSCAGAVLSYARGLVAEPSCPRSGSVFRQAVELAKLGQRAAGIRAAVRASPTSATAPIARERIHPDGCATESGEAHRPHEPQAAGAHVHELLDPQGKN